MKIAVSGASGFIGRHVLVELAKKPVAIVASARSAASLRLPLPAVQVVEMDISKPPHDAYRLLGSPDVLIHLAWGGLPNYQSLHHFEIELPCQYRFLKQLVLEGLPSLVIAGTCLEYGMQSGCLPETLMPQPVTAYGFAKNALREQLGFLQAQHPFSLTWARLFYTYGEGQAGTALYSQIKQAVQEKAAAFNMSGGEQLRDYLPVANVAGLLAELAVAHRDLGIINICSGMPVPVRSLVEQWIAANGWDITLNLGRQPYPSYEPMAFWGDTTKLHALIGATA